MPLGWFFLFGFFIAKKYQLPKIWIACGLFLLGGVTNRYLMAFCIHHWELPTQEIKQITPKKVAIVLTGGLFSENATPQNLHLGTHADRMFQALRLYQEGKVERILISGGTLDNLYSDMLSEAELAGLFYQAQGVKAEHVMIENKARNTFENAKFSIALLQANGVKSKDVYLVTSALHMRRSLACFEKQGWHVAFIATNPLASSLPTWRWIYLIPDYFTFFHANQLIHEWVGWVIYSLVGYL